MLYFAAVVHSDDLGRVFGNESTNPRAPFTKKPRRDLCFLCGPHAPSAQAGRLPGSAGLGSLVIRAPSAVGRAPDSQHARSKHARQLRSSARPQRCTQSGTSLRMHRIPGAAGATYPVACVNRLEFDVVRGQANHGKHWQGAMPN